MRYGVTCGLLAWGMLSSSALAQSGGGNWATYNHDAQGSRTNQEEEQLDATNVAGLHVLWTFPAPGPVYATPAVQGNRLYVGDTRGNMYGLSDDGTLIWQSQTDAGGSITASALIMANHVIVGDLKGVIYGFNRNTGARDWSIEPDTHVAAAFYASAVPVGGNFAIALASQEEGIAGNPNYPCCSSRGSVLLVSPHDGHVIWQTPLITDAERAAGSSGVGVWSTPTYDADSNLLYITTGNNYTEPTTVTSDAIIALNASTGAIVWVNQRTPNDVWNFRFPPSDAHPDADFGDSPQIYRFNGRKVVAAGQKSGFFHVLDAATGDVVHFEQYIPGAALGGFFSDSANADGVNYANGSKWPNGGAPQVGYVYALNGDASQELWHFEVAGGANLSGVAVANDVVYFVSTFKGNLYALDSGNGAQLASVSIGQSVSGPAVAHGRVYLGTGAFSFNPPPSLTGSIVALGL